MAGSSNKLLAVSGDENLSLGAKAHLSHSMIEALSTVYVDDGRPYVKAKHQTLKALEGRGFVDEIEEHESSDTAAKWRGRVTKLASDYINSNWGPRPAVTAEAIVNAEGKGNFTSDTPLLELLSAYASAIKAQKDAERFISRVGDLVAYTTIAIVDACRAIEPTAEPGKPAVVKWETNFRPDDPTSKTYTYYAVGYVKEDVAYENGAVSETINSEEAFMNSALARGDYAEAQAVHRQLVWQTTATRGPLARVNDWPTLIMAIGYKGINTLTLVEGVEKRDKIEWSSELVKNQPETIARMALALTEECNGHLREALAVVDGQIAGPHD